MSIEDLSCLVASVNLSVWNKYIPESAQEEIKAWRVCLVHRFESPAGSGDDEAQSDRLLGYVNAHLRLIVPNQTNVADSMKAELVDGANLRPFHCSRPNQGVFLEDFEMACSEIDLVHLNRLRTWMPWVLKFSEKWRDYYPLYLSLSMFGKADYEREYHVRHLLRVMAIEALVASEWTFGVKALIPRITKLLGWHADLYAPYRSAVQPDLPQLSLSDGLIDDMYKLRNKVAHGDLIPAHWLQKNQRLDLGGEALRYVDTLREAAAAILPACWQKMISLQLQSVFSDKKTMEEYFRQ